MAGGERREPRLWHGAAGDSPALFAEDENKLSKIRSETHKVFSLPVNVSQTLLNL